MASLRHERLYTTDELHALEQKIYQLWASDNRITVYTIYNKINFNADGSRIQDNGVTMELISLDFINAVIEDILVARR